MKDFSEYLGIPYKRHGRDFDGLDCYGLFLIVQKEVYGRTFRDFSYGEISGAQQARFISNNQKEMRALQIHEPKEGCAAILCAGSHIGIYIGDGLILHVSKNADSVIINASDCGEITYYDFIA